MKSSPCDQTPCSHPEVSLVTFSFASQDPQANSQHPFTPRSSGSPAPHQASVGMGQSRGWLGEAVSGRSRGPFQKSSGAACPWPDPAGPSCAAWRVAPRGGQGGPSPHLTNGHLALLRAQCHHFMGNWFTLPHYVQPGRISKGSQHRAGMPGQGLEVLHSPGLGHVRGELVF